jgi:NDP-sugar pyrophosphorylase family protein
VDKGELMIVIPMVGLSSRFFKAGYTKPKYQLELHGETVFDHVIRSFEKYFKTDKFIFACRSDYGAEAFVREALLRHGVENFSIKVIDHDTRGQAETVYLAVKDEPEDELYIFNIDTFRPGFTKPDWVKDCDGYLEVFEGEGEHWSFVFPGNDNSVLKTTEKERVSNLCSDGLYYFSSKRDFEECFLKALKLGLTVKDEYYVAPLYNILIDCKKSVQYDMVGIDRVVFCGTPDEFQKIINKI